MLPLILLMESRAIHGASPRVIFFPLSKEGMTSLCHSKQFVSAFDERRETPQPFGLSSLKLPIITRLEPKTE